MMPEPWISDEAGLVSIARRAIVRAFRRPLRLLVIALLATAGFVVIRLYRPPIYRAMLHFHLTEGEISDPTQGPRPPRAVREYVFNVALSRERVEQIMLKHGWSPRYLATNRVAAIHEFREDVDVEVSRNYFLYDRRPSDAPRSALVTVSLLGSDSERTVATLREIGDAIVEDQRSQRAERLQQGREALEGELARTRARAKALQDEIARLQQGPAVADPLRAADGQERVLALQVEAKSAIDRLIGLERRATGIAFTAAAESEALGLRLDLVDEGLMSLTPDLTPLELAQRALLMFVLALLLAIPVVGAFDDRIYGLEDLAGQGVPIFGELVRFPGDDVGAFRARSQVKRV